MSNWVWFMSALGGGTQNFAMSVDHGSYSLVGGISGASLVAEGGAFAVASDVILARGYATPADQVSYSLLGYSIAPFVRDHRLDAAHAAYHIGGTHTLMRKTFVPVKGLAPYVEGAWERPEAEDDDLDALVTVDVG